MASELIGDIAIKVGSYTDREGKEKGEYRRIGKLMRGDDGEFLLLNADALSMQLFALSNKDRKSAVIASVFKPRDEQDSAQSAPAPKNPDDIPF